MKALLDAKFSNWNDVQRPLVTPVRESVSQDVGRLVMARFSDTNWIVARWEHLTWSVENCEVIKERWPEFLQGAEPRVQALMDFDFLVSIKLGLEGEQPLAHWSMFHGGGVRLARRLRNDGRYRRHFAELLGIDNEDCIERAVAAGAQARNPDFPNSGALRVLASGHD